jgi:6-phosphogluconate dehydrogenase (decarboxylating)
VPNGWRVNLDNTRTRSRKKLVKVGIIGVGRMGSALVRGFLNANMEKKDLLASDYDDNKLKQLCKNTGIRMAHDNIELVSPKNWTKFWTKFWKM